MREAWFFRETQALCQASVSLFGMRLTGPDKLLGAAIELGKGGPGGSTALAISLFNALIQAKQEGGAGPARQVAG